MAVSGVYRDLNSPASTVTDSFIRTTAVTEMARSGQVDYSVSSKSYLLGNLIIVFVVHTAPDLCGNLV